MDVIEKVDGPTKWMNPLVTVEKPNRDIRVCLVMREANKATVRERQPIPTVEETVQEMGGMKVFTKLDLNMALHQVELHPQSRDITTFARQKWSFPIQTPCNRVKHGFREVQSHHYAGCAGLSWSIQYPR